MPTAVELPPRPEVNLHVPYLTSTDSKGDFKELILRSRTMQKLRTDAMPQMIEAYRQLHPDIETTLNLFNEIAPFVDLTFRRQLFTFDKDDPRSWLDYLGVNGAEFKEKIEAYLSNSSLENYWERNPETKNIFQIIKDELISETDPKKLKSIAKKLEEEAVSAYRNGRIVWLFGMSFYYLDKKSAKKYRNPPLLEADLRLVLPIPLESRKYFQGLADVSWQELTRYYGRKRVRRPAFIFGYALGVAGSQLFSSNAGEALSSKAIVILINQFKYSDTAKKIYRLLGVKEDDPLLYQIFIYILHEYGHKFWPKKLARSKKYDLFEELGSDISVFLIALKMFTDLESYPQIAALRIGKFLQEFLIEYTAQALEQPTDGYVISGRFMISELFAAGIAGFTDGKLWINADPVKLENFSYQLKTMHYNLFASDKPTLNKLAEAKLHTQAQNLLNHL